MRWPLRCASMRMATCAPAPTIRVLCDCWISTRGDWLERSKLERLLLRRLEKTLKGKCGHEACFKRWSRTCSLCEDPRVFSPEAKVIQVLASSLKEQHSFEAEENICSSVCWKPGAVSIFQAMCLLGREWCLVSGGLDSAVVYWQRSGRGRKVLLKPDEARPRPRKRSLKQASATATGPQLLNPPFVCAFRAGLLDGLRGIRWRIMMGRWQQARPRLAWLGSSWKRRIR